MTASLLFDLDGTIAETDHLHFEAFKQVFSPFGVEIDWPTYTARVIGKNNPVIAAEFLPHVPQADHEAIMDRKEATYREHLHRLETAPGLLDLLAWAEAHSIPCAVVTNAPRLNADAVLDVLNLRDRFEALVIGPELREAKPHPLPYLTALEQLGAEAAHSVGFEDSPAGIVSAAAAGLGVVGIMSTFDAVFLKAAGAHVAGRHFSDPGLLAYVRQRTTGHDA